MKQRLLGTATALRVSQMALGCGLLGATDNGPDRRQAHDTLTAFAERGGTMIDTSSAHQGGRSEELVGEYVAVHGRDHFVVCTKYGRRPAHDEASLSGGVHPRAMMAQVESSLRRLKTDRIDLYTAEFPDGITPIGEVIRGLDTLVQQGKIVNYALSNYPAWQFAQAAVTADFRGWAPMAAMHYQWNLLERSVEREHTAAAAAFGLGIIAWSPLARGRLAKADGSGITPSMREALQTLARTHDVSPSAIALAWLIDKGAVPVIGARNPQQLIPSLDATELTLAPEEIWQLDKLDDTPIYPREEMAALRASIGIAEDMIPAAALASGR